ncbi:LysM domain-containing protein [Halomonas sp. HP20-15]|uniref:LysM peptidoglycan-binding domain-containing protein n=1 Tax=Halomonas sp. HP20-15 TaxID=3085901 RepID=UPI0029829419|nr:LysM domain-containing protein [Halomonas sp. HP20-15]MDW5376495.1 LysM domain-containing protein [Halomonas sp. HP20-15]
MSEQTAGGRRRWLAAWGVVLGTALGGLLPLEIAAAATLRDDAPSRYTVASGDTLWGIAGRFLAHPWQWPEVWDGNPQIDDPHWIYPGDVVYLYHENGQPRLGLEPGQGGIVRLSPKVREVPRREAIPPLPLESVQRFLEANRIVGPGELDNAAYVIAGDDRRIVSGAGDRIYVRGELPPGERFGIYRRGQRYLDPDSGEFLGLELETLGEARLLRRDGEVSLLRVTMSRQEIRQGDRLLAQESLPVTPAFQPHAPGHPLEGHILAVPGGVQFIGRLDVVALDLGQRDGLSRGAVLAVEQQGETITDPQTGEPVQLPGEDAGWLMVFRLYDRVSYALVMHATRSLAVGDRVHAPRSEDLLAGASLRP